jgi:hypothetical protein
MSKIAGALAGVAVCILTIGAQAQTDAQKKAILSSPYLKKAGACMNAMVSAGKSAGLETDRIGGTILIRDPGNEAKLGEILASTFTCLEESFEMKKKFVDRRPGANVAGTKSWIWYASVEGWYIWCATDGTSVPENVGRMGGQGAKKDWYAITLQCSIGNKVLGWYTPSS